jgi:hypothetical protein
LLTLTVVAITLSTDDDTSLLRAMDADGFAAAAFLVYPIAVVGRRLSSRELLIVAPALVLAAVSMVTACRWVRRATFPLEAAQ